MQKAELVRHMARRAGVSEAEAADRLDRAVDHIVRALRRGRRAVLPGLGTLLPRGRKSRRRRARR